MDCSLPGSSVHGIFQARILQWVAISFSRGSSRPRDWTWVSCTAGRLFTEPPGKSSLLISKNTHFSDIIINTLFFLWLWFALFLCPFFTFKFYIYIYLKCKTSLVAQTVKCLPTMQETWVRSLGREDPLQKEMATHSSTLAWKIPWMEEPGRLQSMGLQRVDTTERLHLIFKMFHVSNKQLTFVFHLSWKSSPLIWSSGAFNIKYNQ